MYTYDKIPEWNMIVSIGKQACPLLKVLLHAIAGCHLLSTSREQDNDLSLQDTFPEQAGKRFLLPEDNTGWQIAHRAHFLSEKPKSV